MSVSAASAKAKLEALDGLRGIAASWVVFHHLHTNSLLDGGALAANGARLVDVFFVLSGFVLAYQYRKRLTQASAVSDFMRRRIARIWPLHAAILLFMAAPRLLSLVLHGPAGNDLFVPAGDHSLPSLLASLAMVQALGIYDYAVWNGPAWSISVEMGAYLVFAFVAWASRGRTTLPAVVICLGIVAYLLFTGMGLRIPYELYILRGLMGFFAGVALLPFYERLVAASPRHSRLLATLLEAASGLCLIAAVGWLGNGAEGFLFVAICAGTVLLYAFQRGAVSAILGREPFQSLGAWSLGVYLLHVPLLNILFAIGRRGPVAGLNFAERQWGSVEVVLFLSLLLLLSCLSYHLLERPARSILSKGTLGERDGPLGVVWARWQATRVPVSRIAGEGLK